jgi:NADH-quinone oxidoreductase subunit L
MDPTSEPTTTLIAALLLLPLCGAVFNGLFGHRLPRSLVGGLACSAPIAAFSCASRLFAALSRAPEPIPLRANFFTWLQAGSLHVDASFVVDPLSAVMILVITGIGSLIHIYSLGYMDHEPAYARYFAYLNLFTFAMLVLVLGDSMPMTFVGWEGVGLCSYLLIGFWYTDDAKASAGKKAFVVNRIGDFGFLVAMMVLLRQLGCLDYAQLQTAVEAGQLGPAAVTAVCLLLILGATGKSAQLPLYVWLPDAMAGPTPVSALIHAATMVTAGIYLTARMNWLFILSPTAMLLMASIGALTAFFAATIGTVQRDIKKVLAYSTVSQLGFMFLAAGVGAYAIALFHVLTHAFFKACLFLGSGSVIHGMGGEQDMRQMGGLYKKMPITCATFVLATLAITGFPFLSGFISKDAILWHAFTADAGPYAATFAGWARGLWLLGICAASLTSFYMWRLVFMTFFSGALRAPPKVAHHVHESPFAMTAPLVLLALLSVFGGLLGWPEIFGGRNPLAHWLLPVVGELPEMAGDTHRLEVGLMGISTGMALLGFLIAYALYARSLSPMAERLSVSRVGGWLHARLLGKWHVDELYDFAVIRPWVWGSKVVLFEGLDRRVIDALVNGVGSLVRSVGFLGQLLQNGDIQRYLAVFVVGLAALLYGWMSPLWGPR